MNEFGSLSETAPVEGSVRGWRQNAEWEDDESRRTRPAQQSARAPECKATIISIDMLILSLCMLMMHRKASISNTCVGSAGLWIRDSVSEPSGWSTF